jgi:hypothetical protein
MRMTDEGDVWLYVYRTGLLSALGHDLRLSVRRFQIRYGDGEVGARFWPESIEIDGSLREDGSIDEEELSASDRKEIKGNIEEDILETGAHPEIRFDGEYDERDSGVYEVAGELEIVGVRESIRTTVRRENEQFRTELEITPSDWGIEPYKALLGSLKVQDRLEIELRVDAGDEE